MQKLFIDWHMLEAAECAWMLSIVQRVDLGDLGPIENEIIKAGVFLSCIQKCINDRGWEWAIEENRIGSLASNFARVSIVEIGRLERPCVCQDRGTLENLLAAYVMALELLVRVRG